MATYERRMRGGYDIDDTKISFMVPFLDFASPILGRKLDYDSMHDFNIALSLGVSSEKAFELLRDFYSSENFSRLPAVDGALDALQYTSLFSDIYDITARDSNLREKTRHALNLGFVSKGISITELIFCPHFYDGKKESKADVAERLKLDYMVEDSPSHSIAISERGIPVFMLRRPWNAHVSSNSLLKVCDSWHQVVEGIDKIRKNGSSA